MQQVGGYFGQGAPNLDWASYLSQGRPTPQSAMNFAMPSRDEAPQSEPPPSPSSSMGADGDLERARASISRLESGGNYGALGPMVGSDRAYGKYQVMGSNVPSWTKEALGKELSTAEFLADKKAQDAVFDHRFGMYLKKYGPERAARAWFAGEGGMGNSGSRDVLGTSVQDYGKRFAEGYAGGGLIDWLFGEKDPDPQRSWDMDPPVTQWPSQADVQAARAYKEQYHNPNEAMIQGPPLVRGGTENVRPASATIGPVVHNANVQRLVNDSDYSRVQSQPYNDANADKMYAAQLAANTNPIASLGFDPDKMVRTIGGGGRNQWKWNGAYLPDLDKIWLTDQSYSTPVHESMHRGLEMLRKNGPDVLEGSNKGIEPFKEEYLVRRMMQNQYGPIETENTTRLQKEAGVNPINLPVELQEASKPDRDMDKYIKKINRKAHYAIAKRTIDREGAVK